MQCLQSNGKVGVNKSCFKLIVSTLACPTSPLLHSPADIPQICMKNCIRSKNSHYHAESGLVIFNYLAWSCLLLCRDGKIQNIF